MLDWSDIRVFLAVYRAGSTLGASRTLGISQPTVARRIDVLEHCTGLTLFERDTRGFRPTAAARDLLAQAEALEAAAIGFEDGAARHRKRAAKAIRITAPRRNFSSPFNAILAEFSTANPGVGFELISSYEVLDLMEGEADVAIRIAKDVSDQRLVCTKLTDVKSTLFASRGYAERRGLPRSPEEFADHSFVIYDPVPPTMLLNKWLLDRIRPDQIVARSDDVESVTASIDAGLGIGPVPVAFAADYASLVRCFDPPAGTDVHSWLLASPDAYRRPEVRAFVEFFAPRFRSVYTRMRDQAAAAQVWP